MELRHLRYFIAVAEEENITRAAARLHVSQPPLTRQIRDLEEEIGIELFERTAKSIKLTEAGRLFLKEARSAMRRVDDAIHAVRAFGREGSSDVHIGYAPSPTASLLPTVLRVLKKRCPRLQATLHDHSSPEMLAGLREGRLHAAFMMEPTRAAARGVTFEKLRSYPIVLALAPKHPLARRRSLDVAAVLREPLVVYSRTIYPDYHEFLARIVGPRSKRIAFAEECDSGMSLIAAVQSGKGVAITASTLAETAGRRLAFVPITPAPSPAVVGIAYRKGQKNPLTEAIIEAARDAAANG
jgi:DNA-binding transcriptional LysR family regulator